MMTTPKYRNARETEAKQPGLIGRALHWSVALLVIFQGLLGYANLHFTWFYGQGLTTIALHEDVGLMIFVLTLWMLAQRWFEGRRSGHGLDALQSGLAAAMHAALYGLILAESLLGIWIMGLTGDGLSFLFWHINLPIKPDPMLVYGWVMQLHAAVAATLASAVALHALAALHHHFVIGDDVLRRMLPWKSRSAARVMASSR
ncbi:cytochrome b [Acidihalobacter ferrooxydans]|uniref:Cytochrome b561 bacterial/Ni-hydrogenase domain-containing protein n=1 Tax=Acidihalobacter ferrooxydans TaxID=1765967 RepID=A0A1P8UIH6_9GAMM|nr:cytochrome b/b6 domain-containing protein [Acidihalobacter ferrooxydans]APZ43617.1 hypothetical protein BW247_11410 [Acidihalobacter ferrooxydans]